MNVPIICGCSRKYLFYMSIIHLEFEQLILLSGYIKVGYEVEVIRLPSYVLFKQFCPSLGFNSFTYRTKRKYNTPEDKIKFSF